MTCIVGFVDKQNNKVLIGGDSAGVGGLNVRVRKDSKVFTNKDMVFGFTTSFRMGQILRFHFNPPKHKEGQDDYEYMCTTFIRKVTSVLEKHGFGQITKGEKSGGEFLVGYKGNLYHVESDYQVGMVYEDFDACGCGEDYAIGVFSALENYDDVSPKDKILKALETASRFSKGVDPPFNIVEI